MSEQESTTIADESMENADEVEADPVDAVLAEESGLGYGDGEEGGEGEEAEGEAGATEGGNEDGDKKEGEEGEDGEKGEKKERILMDPSKGFIENEQDKMIAASWQYRIKLLAMNYKTREMNHENIEKLVNISQNAAMYYKFGKLELMLVSQVAGQLAMEKILKMNIPSKPLSLYLMRKNEDKDEVAFMKLLPRASHQINFPKNQSDQTSGNVQSRSVYVSNIPEGTSDELLQVLFPCSVSITKPEDKEAGTVLVECLDAHSARCLIRSFLKVQISHNVLNLTSAFDDKDGEGDDKDDKERDARRSLGYKKQNKINKRTATFQPYPRGGRGARARGRGFGPTAYSRGGYSMGAGVGGGDAALHQQIAMLQQNISMLTQAVNPMMMRGGGRGTGMGQGSYSSGANRPNKRRRQFSNQGGTYNSGDNYNGDSYTTSRSSYGSSNYGGGMQSGYSTSGGYGSGNQYGSGMGGSGGGGSWGSGTSGSNYSQGGHTRYWQ